MYTEHRKDRVLEELAKETTTESKESKAKRKEAEVLRSIKVDAIATTPSFTQSSFDNKAFADGD